MDRLQDTLQATKRHIEKINRDKINYTLKSYNDYKVITLTNKKSVVRDYKKNPDGKKSLQSLQRARRKILDIFNLNLCYGDLIFTLTYADNMQDYKQTHIDFKVFIEKLRKKYTFEYIAIQELQERGAIHYHMVMFNYGENIYITELELLNIWGHGIVSVDTVREDNKHSLPFYFSKYLTDYKKNQLIDKNKRLYNTSRGIKKTIIEKISYDDFKKENINNSIEIIKNGYVKYVLPK